MQSPDGHSGFTLTVDNYNRTSDMCTHYCPGSTLTGDPSVTRG